MNEQTDKRLKQLNEAEFFERYACDRFTATVLTSRFRYIIKHMCTHLLTNAFSPILRDWYDFSATLSGPPDLGYPMSAASDSLMIFNGAMSEAVRNSVEEFGPGNLRSGDVLMCNDPMRTGTHVNDLCYMRPVFVEDEIVAFVNIQPHMMDMGGIVPAGFSAAKRNVYENGLVIPPMLLYRDERPIRSAFSLIFDNARFGEIMLPDMLSVAADLRLGERLVLEAIERYGLLAYRGALRYATDVSAEAMRDAIARTPDGVYVGEEMIDCDGIDDSEEYRIRATVTIVEDRIEVDLSGSSRQARTCINCGWLDAKTSVSLALKFLIEPTEPFTSGAFRHLDIVLPRASIVSAEPPDGAIFLYWEPACALLLAIFRALAEALGPDAVAGDFCSAMVHNAVGVGPDGRPWASSSVCGGELGPWGGTRVGDGENSLAMYMANSIAPAAEAVEASAPVVFLKREIAPDTAGPGLHRGGAAIVKDTLWLTESDQYTNAVRIKRPTGFGVNGGHDGTGGGIWMWDGAAGEEIHFYGSDADSLRSAIPIAGVLDPGTHVSDPTNGTYFYFGRESVWHAAPRTVMRYQTNAAGGWGDPLKRPAEKVLADVRNEYISGAAAHDVYGVVVIGDPESDPEGLRVDETATAKLRGG
jgi:N-methylhydantoinase B